MLDSATTVLSPAEPPITRPRTRLAIPASPTLRDPRRHLLRKGVGEIHRRDQRRFGRAMVRQASSVAVNHGPSDGLRLFAHTFGAAFLFVMVFIA